MMPHRIYAMVGMWALAAGAVAQSDRPDAIGIPARTDQSPAAAAAVALPAGATIRVKTIHPKRGPEIAVSVEQPAEIAPYYKAELYAPIAGTVTFLEKSLGDAVSAGERLVEITPFGAGPEQPGLGVLRAPFEGVIAARSIDPGGLRTQRDHRLRPGATAGHSAHRHRHGLDGGARYLRPARGR